MSSNRWNVDVVSILDLGAQTLHVHKVPDDVRVIGVVVCCLSARDVLSGLDIVDGDCCVAQAVSAREACPRPVLWIEDERVDDGQGLPELPRDKRDV